MKSGRYAELQPLLEQRVKKRSSVPEELRKLHKVYEITGDSKRAEQLRVKLCELKSHA